MASEIKVTLETLFNILRKEKNNSELQKLSSNFYKDVLTYFEKKNSYLKSMKIDDLSFSIQKNDVQRDIANAYSVLKQIYERREKKILELALISSRSNTKPNVKNFLPEEQLLFKEMLSVLNFYRKGILLRILSLKEPDVSKKIEISDMITSRTKDYEEEYKFLRLVTEVPQFVGNDMNVYGPFNEDDFATLPKDVANILKDKHFVEFVKTKI
jgi:DNA replication initiation complex subunit (GINS family)